MSDENRASPVPFFVRKMLKKPPIMAGEDRAEYEELVRIVRKEIKRRDVQEWLLLMDIVEAEWVLQRLRGVKVGMLHNAIPGVLHNKVSKLQVCDLWTRATTVARSGARF